jgi:Skp family chaperone for outer membrane proteins
MSVDFVERESRVKNTILKGINKLSTNILNKLYIFKTIAYQKSHSRIGKKNLEKTLSVTSKHVQLILRGEERSNLVANKLKNVFDNNLVIYIKNIYD